MSLQSGPSSISEKQKFDEIIATKDTEELKKKYLSLDNKTADSSGLTERARFNKYKEVVKKQLIEEKLADEARKKSAGEAKRDATSKLEEVRLQMAKVEIKQQAAEERKTAILAQYGAKIATQLGTPSPTANGHCAPTSGDATRKTTTVKY